MHKIDCSQVLMDFEGVQFLNEAKEPLTLRACLLAHVRILGHLVLSPPEQSVFYDVGKKLGASKDSLLLTQ